MVNKGGGYRLIESDTGRELRQVPASFRGIFSPDGRLIAAEDKHDIVLEETETGKKLGRIPAPGGYNHKLAFTTDSKTFALLQCEGDKDHQLRLWDVPAMRERRALTMPLCDPYPLLFSPDGRIFVVGTQRDKGTAGLLIVETAIGQVRQEIRFDKIVPSWTWPPNVFFSPDGEYLLIGDGSAGVTVVDPFTGDLLRRRQDHRSTVGHIAFSPSRRLMATASGDATILIWNAPDFLRPARPKSLTLSESDLASAWDNLGSPDAQAAAVAMRRLMRAAGQAVPLLSERLQPSVPVTLDAKKLAQWLADLDSDAFDTRKKAESEIEKLGESARPALEKALADQPSVELRRTGERLLAKLSPASSPSQRRTLRAVEVLEHIATPESRGVLESLVKGAPEALLTREAKAALDRLARRPTSAP
jgi:hypothetical protein